jgi:tetratricopeptide (TPR) repeat protein
MKAISGIAALIILAASPNLHAAPHCGEVDTPGSYGPYDYTNPDDKATKLPVVEAHHFGPDVEKLIRGSTGLLGADLNYTLTAFPNHHRALAAMGKLSIKEKIPKPKGARYSVDCYFDRAIRFRPRDSAVRVIYSNHLLKMGKSNEALEQLKEAINLQPENPAINYNLGLLYIQKKDYEQAKMYAKKAYGLGFPLPGLKNKLVEAGKWDD